MQGVVIKRKMLVPLLMYLTFASALFAVSDKGKKENGSWFPPECECPDVESFDVACSGTDCPPGEMQVASSCSGGFGSCLSCIDNAGAGLCCDTEFFEATQSGGCGGAFVNPVAIERGRTGPYFAAGLDRYLQVRSGPSQKEANRSSRRTP